MKPTPFTRRLGIAHPVMLAPMAGGPSTTALCIAVCEAGGLGSHAGAYLAPDKLREEIRSIRAATSRPFAVNLFADDGVATDEATVRAARDALARYRAELGLPPTPEGPVGIPGTLREVFPILLEERVPVFSFTFGIPPVDIMDRMKERGTKLVGTATTVAEARALEQAGVDAIVAQGSEAGAHRGTFAAGFEAAMIGTLALVPPVVDAVRVPVIASGGVMDGRGIAAALALGAEAVQMGTAFLTTVESGIPSAYKDAVLAAREIETRVTRSFSGRAARGIANRFMNEVEARGTSANLGYPAQNALTRSLRTEAAKQNRSEFLSLWAGQGVRLARQAPAADLVRRLVAETSAAIDRLAARNISPPRH